MSTCLEVITDAFADLDVRGRGDTLEPDEAARGLRSLQSLYAEAVGFGFFGRQTETTISDAYTAKENERIYDEGATASTVTLPATITECGDTRPPRDLSIVTIAGDQPQIFLFSGWRGVWDTLTGLALSDYAPLSERSHDGLVALLSVRIASQNRKTLAQPTGELAMAFRSLIGRRADGPRITTQAEFY